MNERSAGIFLWRESWALYARIENDCLELDRHVAGGIRGILVDAESSPLGEFVDKRDDFIHGIDPLLVESNTGEI